MNRHERRASKARAAQQVGKEMPYLAAPRIEVILTQSDEIPESEDGAAVGPYDAWLALHAPDGQAPATVPLDGGPWDRTGVVMLIETIITAIGEKVAPTRSIGAMGLGRNMT